MSLRKIIFSSFAIILALEGAVQAQESTTQGQPSASSVSAPQLRQQGLRRREMKTRKRLAGRGERLGLRELNLSGEQQQQRQAIRERHLSTIRTQRDQLAQLRQRRMEGNLTAEDLAKVSSIRQELRSTREAMRGEMQNMLTSE